jgi:4-amino-4-deoxy-L-arabinose transferase-like glycosyltransferase
MVRISDKRVPVAIAVLLLAVMFAVEITTSFGESQIIDEAVHLSAGVSYWKTGDFRLNPEHPPLIKLMAALPLSLFPVKTFTDHPTWIAWNEWEYGDYFLYHNIFSVQTMLMFGRIPLMLLSVAFGWWIFRASADLFGRWGGTFSVALYTLDPNIIAHSRYITTDLGFSAFAFLSIYRLVKLLQQPTRVNGIWFGAAYLAMALSKFSSLPFTLIIIATVVMVKVLHPELPALQRRTVKKWLLLAIPSMALVVWGMYGFDVRSPSEDPRIGQLYSQRETLLQQKDPQSLPPLERFVVTKLGDRGQRLGQLLEDASRLRIPAYAFFRGTFAVIGHSIGGQSSYLLGQTSDRGWWYYFPVAIMTKTPLPTLLVSLSLIMLGCTALIRARRRSHGFRDLMRSIPIPTLLYACVPALFLATSMASNLNLGWRHIMPIYPFLFVLAGSLTRLPSVRFVRSRAIVPALIVGNLAIVQIGTYPNEIGYFNSLVGGMRDGPRYLLDSNIDWGQDLPKLQHYLRTNGITRLPFDYYGRATVSYYIPQAVPLPSTGDLSHGTARPHGVIAISVGSLFRTDRNFDWLWKEQPLKRIGYSINIYVIDD